MRNQIDSNDLYFLTYLLIANLFQIAFWIENNPVTLVISFLWLFLAVYVKIESLRK